jgi:hypothetical protein
MQTVHHKPCIVKERASHPARGHGMTTRLDAHSLQNPRSVSSNTVACWGRAGRCPAAPHAASKPTFPVRQHSPQFCQLDYRPACDMEPCRECDTECDSDSDTRSRSGTAALLKLPLRLRKRTHDWPSCSVLAPNTMFHISERQMKAHASTARSAEAMLQHNIRIPVRHCADICA